VAPAFVVAVAPGFVVAVAPGFVVAVDLAAVVADDDFDVVALPAAVVAVGLAVVAAPATVVEGRATESLDESEPHAASTRPPLATNVAIFPSVLMCRCLPAPTPADGRRR